MRQKHYDLIMAWANGAEIEYCHRYSGWSSTTNPNWDEDTEYRIKPEPKPDVVLYSYASKLDGDFGLVTSAWLEYSKSFRVNKPNIKLIYDGATKELKDVEKI